MSTVTVNYAAILISAIVFMALGMLWYSKLFFGKKWAILIGLNEGEKPQGAGKSYAISFISALVMAVVLTMVIGDGTGAWYGAQIGFWMWLGFVGTAMLSEFLYAIKPKPWPLYYINTGYYLVSMIIMSIILASWK